jgi:molybdopterin biosynthesis enzyme
MYMNSTGGPSATMPRPNEFNEIVSTNRHSIASAFQSAKCEVVYPWLLQGICTNERDSIYWS